jgi:hypothetical protein
MPLASESRLYCQVKCHYAECRYAECGGATEATISLVFIGFGFNALLFTNDETKSFWPLKQAKGGGKMLASCDWIAEHNAI